MHSEKTQKASSELINTRLLALATNSKQNDKSPCFHMKYIRKIPMWEFVVTVGILAPSHLRKVTARSHIKC